MHPSSPKSHILLTSPPLVEIVSWSYLKCCLPGYSPHFAPNKNLTHNYHIVLFFLVDIGDVISNAKEVQEYQLAKVCAGLKQSLARETAAYLRGF